MFYRVRVNNKISDTFVFDNLTAASAVYDVLRVREDKVEFEMVADDGEVLTKIVTEKVGK